MGAAGDGDPASRTPRARLTGHPSGTYVSFRPALPSHSKKYEREFQFRLIMSTFAADSHEKEKRGVPGGGPTPLGP